MEIEGTEASHEVGIDSTSGVSSPHPAPPPRLSAAPLRCCISTQFWVSVCLAEPWIIKDIFLTPVWFSAGAAVCPLCFVVWGWEVKGRKLASVKWGEGAGLISAVSELRAPRAAACCPRGAQGRVRKCCGSCEKQGLENERPCSPGGPSPSRESLSYSQWHRDNPGSVCVTKITEASDQLVPLDGEGAMALHLHWRPCSPSCHPAGPPLEPSAYTLLGWVLHVPRPERPGSAFPGFSDLVGVISAPKPLHPSACPTWPCSSLRHLCWRGCEQGWGGLRLPLLQTPPGFLATHPEPVWS